jgi:hypothetical protein
MCVKPSIITFIVLPKRFSAITVVLIVINGVKMNSLNKILCAIPLVVKGMKQLLIYNLESISIIMSYLKLNNLVSQEYIT